MNRPWVLIPFAEIINYKTKLYGFNSPGTTNYIAGCMARVCGKKSCSCLGDGRNYDAEVENNINDVGLSEILDYFCQVNY
jgi:hypothetical protein